MTEIRISEKSKLVGKKLGEFWAKETLNLTIAAINRNHAFLPTSLETETIAANDILIVIGPPASIQKLTRLIEGG
ncbi:TrkA C-terminal domain-containing protein [Sporomusa acidovorans]|uniref:RCK C-terminal domain-containing protein n=1 Tax=Sporomusa acidovorans (strain ATCC 49682 / DSM 3132 / Mol) TaxID=1123286 RepID=A0ABZ3J540_SPOA4|nr:TrkA C-terminal domain-containing protein [Sporomusa acidovorans]OZC18284.1 potassium transporter peripheral membrane component [Sporomusa acidovorans DSM 3132]SDF26551.1 TrkA-C domain-containing protein [Sporomusa acidovorans]